MQYLKLYSGDYSGKHPDEPTLLPVPVPPQLHPLPPHPQTEEGEHEPWHQEDLQQPPQPHDSEGCLCGHHPCPHCGHLCCL